MNSSTRLYERLGQIPQDPEDPESLEDLIVCAFGAFERYYVCWKNKGGEFRQDGYDLPPALQDWLFPTDGTTRDFPTLQVVFGRGDEYFASDKNGKLEFKEPEKKAPSPDELEDKPPLRRSRTVSFLRPLSDASTKQVTPGLGTPPTRRSSNASQSSRPPSLLFSSTRSMSDVSLASQPAVYSRTDSESSIASQSSSRPSSTTSTLPSSRPPSDPEVKPIDITESPTQEQQAPSPVPAPLRLTRRSRPLSMSFSNGPFPRIPEGKQLPPREPTPPLPPLPPLPTMPLPRAPTMPLPKPPTRPPDRCTCGFHPPKPVYADAGIQTDPLPSPPRTALRIDTVNAPFPYYSNTSSAQDIETPLDDYYEGPVGPNPVLLGRMLDYYSKPGYQLGDGLSSGYYAYQQQGEVQQAYEVYEVEDGLVDEAWLAANGRGA